jgi:Protein of unknown function (DUF2752)
MHNNHQHPGNSFGYTRQDRFGYLTTIAWAVATLFIARLLQPSPSGMGTHEQLGLPACPFFHFTGFPCPTCGFTTCFAHGARLHFYQAFVTQPFGFAVFCLTIASIPTSLFLMHRRIAWTELFHSRRSNLVVYGLLLLLLFGWLYKIVAMKWIHIAV